MLELNFATTARIVLRDGALDALPEIFGEFGVKHVALITDPGLVKAGLVAPVEKSLKAAGLAVTLYDGVQADPPTRIVLAAVDDLRAAGVDGVLGLGGGSAMDVAKLVAYLLKTPEPLEKIYGVDLAKGARLPLVLAPTTAGTGSEVTPISIVTTETDEKKGVVSRRLLPDVALLDPNLTLGLPAPVTAATGVDAMVHAIEAYTSKRLKNPLSDVLARQALALLSKNLPVVMKDGKDKDARGQMLLGSCLAGMAFANAPVAAVHALAYPLGGHFHVPHGLSNALMLLPVLRFNLAGAAPLYAELSEVVGGEEKSAEGFFKAIERIVGVCDMPKKLHELQIPRDILPKLAEDAMKQTRLLVNNPVEVTEPDALRLYEEAF
ncbi:iron-containing alcohol dehydrogenase [Roseomonas sp. NAR14]|uniref:Alcohol dehydrogenase 2 n=1 Tax=Roseomonas acroporae TaxID=2937791 RepID=A0A9X1YDL0_9PROT|nr:iron-containing alcohol dehydrogenase [Roseomonas acroporae]MCK8788196.1 iron-containing alcohol dehydrogenase [Roseomonas acroporae]